MLEQGSVNLGAHLHNRLWHQCLLGDLHVPPNASMSTSWHSVVYLTVMHWVMLRSDQCYTLPCSLHPGQITKFEDMRDGNQDLQEGCLIALRKLPPVIQAPEVDASILDNCRSVSAST